MLMNKKILWRGSLWWLARGLALCSALLSGHAALAADPAYVKLRYQVQGASSLGTGAALRLVFPLLRLADPQSTEALNLLLHHLVLNTLPPVAGSAEAAGQKEIVLAANEATVGATELTVSAPKLRFEGRVLTVSLDGESCGAYCENYVRPMALDVQGGRLLMLPDLLTPQGLAQVQKLAVAAHRRTLQNALARIKRDSRKKPRDKELAETLEIQEALYADCLTRYSPGGYLADGQHIGGMRLEDKGMVLTEGRCSNHAMRALDDLGDLSFRIGMEALQPHLSDYGRSLLMPLPVAPDAARTEAPAQIYKGMIDGRLPVTLFIDLRDGPATRATRSFGEATYYYNRYRKPIALELERKEGFLNLTEKPQLRDDAEAKTREPSGVLRLRVQAGQLSGEWRGGGKTLPFSAEPFPVVSSSVASPPAVSSPAAARAAP